MKKQLLTRQHIQRELFAKLNAKKTVAIWLTAIMFAAIFCYVIYVVAYVNGNDLINEESSFTSPSLLISIGPLIILFFVVFLLRYYYIGLYKIKTMKIEIAEQRLNQKVIEHVLYFHRSEKENTLYFDCGRIAVDQEVYSYSNVGDSFYIVLLHHEKIPCLIYHTKYFEIET